MRCNTRTGRLGLRWLTERENTGIRMLWLAGCLSAGCQPVGQNQAIALMAADRRLLWRAALFLWMIFLSAMESTTLVDLLKTA